MSGCQIDAGRWRRESEEAVKMRLCRNWGGEKGAADCESIEKYLCFY